MEKEFVNHPEHYKDKNGKECIDYMLAKWGKLGVITFCIMNAYKYRFRMGKKEGNSERQDLQKALWYESYAYNLHSQLNGISKYISKKIILKLFE